MHAPLFHSALKPLGPVRRALGVKTFFNMMGPLVNPARPKKQVSGVYSLELIPFYKYIMEEDNMQFSIVHGLDGYDEISLTGVTKFVTENGEQLMEPEDFGQTKLNPTMIHGSDSIQGATALFKGILNGEGTPEQNSVVLTNAAVGIQCLDRNKSFSDAYEEAKAALESGSAKENLNRLIASINY